MKVNRDNRLLVCGTCAGYEYFVISNDMGFRCGYVRVPAGHPWHGVHYDRIDAYAHGGLTYSDDHVPTQESDGQWAVGFDCGHCLDGFDPSIFDATKHAKGVLESLSKVHIGTIKDNQYVTSECMKLCRQAYRADSTTNKMINSVQRIFKRIRKWWRSP